MAANADKMAGAMRRPSISRTLTDLGDLHKAKQISDQEFHSMRKQIIDKAYKNII